MKDSSRNRSMITAASAAIVLTILGAIGMAMSGRHGVYPAKATENDAPIRVVTGVDAALRPIPAAVASTPEPLPTANPSDAQEIALKTDMITQFPMLYDANIECDPDCVFVATLGPNATTGNWPPLNWPYNGNLEKFLIARGFKVRGPLVVDQPGDNDTLLRVPATPPADYQR